MDRLLNFVTWGSRTWVPQTTGGWHIFAGPNGAGKTTALRAIALALAPKEQTSKILPPYLPPGKIRVGWHNEEHHAEVISQGQTRKVESTGKRLVVGYGSQRVPSTTPQDGLASLMTGQPSLVDIFDSLCQMERRSTCGDEKAAVELQREIHIIKTVQGASHVSLGEEDVLIDGRPLQSLGEGAVATLRWVFDAWVRTTHSLHCDGLFEPSVVLVDEFDAHLDSAQRDRMIRVAPFILSHCHLIVSSLTQN